jgi:hypothetical protein
MSTIYQATLGLFKMNRWLTHGQLSSLCVVELWHSGVKFLCVLAVIIGDQRVGIAFCIKASKSATQTLQMIQNAYGSSALSHSKVY